MKKSPWIRDTTPKLVYLKTWSINHIIFRTTWTRKEICDKTYLQHNLSKNNTPNRASEQCLHPYQPEEHLPCPCPASTSLRCTHLPWLDGLLWPWLLLQLSASHHHPILLLQATETHITQKLLISRHYNKAILQDRRLLNSGSKILVPLLFCTLPLTLYLKKPVKTRKLNGSLEEVMLSHDTDDSLHCYQSQRSQTVEGTWHDRLRCTRVC